MRNNPRSIIRNKTLRGQNVRVIDPQFRGVFDDDDTLAPRNEIDKCVEQSCLAAAGPTAD